MNFFVDFNKNGETFTLQFQIYKTPIAIKWFAELKQTLTENIEIREPDRLYQFNNKWNKETIIIELNRIIDVVNSWKKCIELRASDDQDVLNNLHHHFEMIRGSVLEPGDFYLEAPPNIKKSIDDFNITIHRLEDLLKSKIPKPRVVITWQDINRKLLDDIDYDYFSLDIKFGEVYVNYCEIGKTLWDVFRDNDKIVGDDNIRPLRYYSSEMAIAFCDGSYKKSINKFWNWFDSNSNFLNYLGFYKHDKKLSIGQLPVAKLISNLSNEIILEELSQCTHVKKVWIT